MSTISAKLRPFRMSRLMPVLLAIAVSATISLDAARAEYPDHPITIVACFPVGGGNDFAMRIISAPLGEALGKPVIVENRGGAGGLLGTAAVARAPGDGYTLLGCSSAFDVNPSLYANAAYDPIKDFVPIIVLGASPNVFVVPAQSKIKTMHEFIADAKANPGKLNWTSPGAGTTPQLAGEILKARAGIEMVHIPFAGAGPANNAVMAGQVDMYTANYASALPLLNSGKARPIAVTSKNRWPDLPDVPTLDEIGIKDAETDTFQAIFAPAGTPKLIVDRLAKEIAAILARPDVRERFQNIGLPVVAEGPDAFRARVAREVPMYKDAIEKAGLKIQ
jgi:tripartite-type tricarboxylate transporter receptor subunit TctC